LRRVRSSGGRRRRGRLMDRTGMGAQLHYNEKTGTNDGLLNSCVQAEELRFPECLSVQRQRQLCGE
jgi:hypothetical protein